MIHQIVFGVGSFVVNTVVVVVENTVHDGIVLFVVVEVYPVRATVYLTVLDGVVLNDAGATTTPHVDARVGVIVYVTPFYKTVRRSRALVISVDAVLVVIMYRTIHDTVVA